MKKDVTVVNSNDSKIAILRNIRTFDKNFTSEIKGKYIVIRYKGLLDTIIDTELCVTIKEVNYICFLETKHPKLIIERFLFEPSIRKFQIFKIK